MSTCLEFVQWVWCTENTPLFWWVVGGWVFLPSHLSLHVELMEQPPKKALINFRSRGSLKVKVIMDQWNQSVHCVGDSDPCILIQIYLPHLSRIVWILFHHSTSFFFITPTRFLLDEPLVGRVPIKNLALHFSLPSSSLVLVINANSTLAVFFLQCRILS